MLGLVACGGGDGARGTARAERPPVYVDRIVPRDVSLARFREGLSDPGRLEGGAESGDELVRRWVAALERRDTAALVAMTLTRAEFAFLYYPTAPEAKPPYDLDPGLAWFMLREDGRKGLLRALDDRGGLPLGYVGYTCDEKAARHGGNAIWAPCLVRRVRAPGDTVEERLFGPIVERDGRFKFLSFANKL